MNNNKKTVCVITGTRAEYGLLRPLIEKLQSSETLELRLVATGSHLSPAFGETYKEIEADGYHIHAKIKMPLDSDTHAGMAKATGAAIISFTEYFESNRPDMVVVLGDRYEILSVAIAASMLRIPIAHISGGDTTEGIVDEFIRHSITKMSYLHFPTNEQSRRRVIQLGEAPERVFNVGSLNIDNIFTQKLLAPEELSDKLGIDLKSRYSLVTYHPVTLHEDKGAVEFSDFLKTVDQFPDMMFLFTKANADSGGRAINTKLDEFVSTRENCAAYASLGSLLYLSAMKHAYIVVGNSSSGLYETPSFGVPCVNIGDRQRGRLRAANVIDCEPTAESIKAAMEKACLEEFRAVAQSVTSPFGNGHAAEKITETIEHYLCNGNIDISKAFYVIDEKCEG